MLVNTTLVIMAHLRSQSLFQQNGEQTKACKRSRSASHQLFDTCLKIVMLICNLTFQFKNWKLFGLIRFCIICFVNIVPASFEADLRFHLKHCKKKHCMPSHFFSLLLISIRMIKWPKVDSDCYAPVIFIFVFSTPKIQQF